MKRYSVTLMGYRSKKFGKSRWKDDPSSLNYAVEANNALMAADRAKELASQHYPEYKEFEVYDVTEER